jgi:translation initiation factor IF-2
MLGHSDAAEEGCDHWEPRYGARASAPDPPPAPRESRTAPRLTPRLAPLFELCRPKEGKPAPAPAPAPAARGPLVHPTPARRQLAPIFTRPAPAAEAKVAPVFEPSGRAAADKAAAHWPGKRGLVPAAKRAKPAGAAGAGKKPAREPVTNSVVVDRSTGLAYFVHEDGRRSPRQM